MPSYAARRFEELSLATIIRSVNDCLSHLSKCFWYIFLQMSQTFDYLTAPHTQDTHPNLPFFINLVRTIVRTGWIMAALGSSTPKKALHIFRDPSPLVLNYPAKLEPVAGLFLTQTVISD